MDYSVDIIKQFEGLSLKPYLCPNKVPTIGYGSTLYENGKKVSMNDPNITQERAEVLLRSHISQNIIPTLVKYGFDETLNKNQLSALISFIYNVGASNFMRSTMLLRLNDAKYVEAADEFLKWDKAGGKQLDGLTKRRKAERELFLK